MSESESPATGQTEVRIAADYYDREATVASDGRLWLGEEWAGEDVEVALRRKGGSDE